MARDDVLARLGVVTRSVALPFGGERLQCAYQPARQEAWSTREFGPPASVGSVEVYWVYLDLQGVVRRTHADMDPVHFLIASLTAGVQAPAQALGNGQRGSEAMERSRLLLVENDRHLVHGSRRCF